MEVKTTYIYANAEVLAQHDGDVNAARYFYLHDRLGSVRQVIDTNGLVNNRYTYDPWGYWPSYESFEAVDNLYRFAGYAWDIESLTYYCVNRIYDPILWRFTSRDPIEGTYENPMTLHRYLYCNNDPINKTDPTGKLGIPGVFREFAELYEARTEAFSNVLAFASGDWGMMIEGLVSVQNAMASRVEASGLANRAFGAIGCVVEAKKEFVTSLMDCVTGGLRDHIFAAAGCIVGCAFTGPLMPVCLDMCGLVAGISLSLKDAGCTTAAVGNYVYSVENCLR
jgi:RHS repeat-associated protein